MKATTDNKHKYETFSHDDASRLGFSAVTTGYQPHEYPMLDNTIRDMFGIQFLLVTTYEGIHVYRKNKEVKISGGTRKF